MDYAWTFCHVMAYIREISGRSVIPSIVPGSLNELYEYMINESCFDETVIL